MNPDRGIAATIFTLFYGVLIVGGGAWLFLSELFGWF